MSRDGETAPPPHRLEVWAALLHYPTIDKHNDVVTTSVTNLDVHDIARSARTYGLSRYYIVTPTEAQHWLVRRIQEHWEKGWGAAYNPNRTDALSLVHVARDLAEVCHQAEASAAERGVAEGERAPRLVATSAKPFPNTIRFGDLRARLAAGTAQPAAPTILLFGTGWGLHPEIVAECDEVLEPIYGPTKFNHLSVRAAAAIIFDKLLGGSVSPIPAAAEMGE